jgi:hypothetical protein
VKLLTTEFIVKKRKRKIGSQDRWLCRVLTWYLHKLETINKCLKISYHCIVNTKCLPFLNYKKKTLKKHEKLLKFM